MDKITKLGKYETENGYIKLWENESGEIEIEEMEAYKKRQGTGAELLKMAVEYARQQEKPLTLCAHPTYKEGQEGYIDFDSLVDFYENNGFSVDCVMGDCAIMYYM